VIEQQEASWVRVGKSNKHVTGGKQEESRESNWSGVGRVASVSVSECMTSCLYIILYYI
jgi:hypothetical protein